MAHRGLPLERAPPLAAPSSPSSISSRHGWFQTDARGVVLRRQRGVVRANCMDNLDRTNVVQSVLARRAILNQLRATAGADASALEDAGKECIIHSSLLATQRACFACGARRGLCSREAFAPPQIDARLLLSHFCYDFNFSSNL